MIMAIKTTDRPIIYCSDSLDLAEASVPSELLKLLPVRVCSDQPSEDIYLIWEENILKLYSQKAAKLGLSPLFFDFSKYWKDFVQQKGRSANGPLAKALGSRGDQRLQVFDATCGSGKDSFLMGSFGVDIIACEQNPWIFLLLRDAQRRFTAADFSLTILFGAAEELLKDQRNIDVIYFDPMYPESKKKALPRKEMQYFRDLVQETVSPEQTLSKLLDFKISRLIVKRPLNSPQLLPPVKHSYLGKSARYDMYKPH